MWWIELISANIKTSYDNICGGRIYCNYIDSFLLEYILDGIKLHSYQRLICTIVDIHIHNTYRIRYCTYYYIISGVETLSNYIVSGESIVSIETIIGRPLHSRTEIVTTEYSSRYLPAMSSYRGRFWATGWRALCQR